VRHQHQVERVFTERSLTGLETPKEVAAALTALRNILAEMAALYDRVLHTNHTAPSNRG
jgi:hypothetical protein